MISEEINNINGFDYSENGVELTQKNVLLAETIYSILNKNSKLKTQFDSLLCNYTKETLLQICITINAENGTHLRNYERDEICKALYKKCKNLEEFKTNLLKREYPLVQTIRKLRGTKIQNNTIRDNYSFATKFCHYACYYLFEKDEERDFYPIYDSVVSEYVKSTNVYTNSNKNIDNYSDYVELIDKIIEGKDISRNGFDHLIWLANR